MQRSRYSCALAGRLFGFLAVLVVWTMSPAAMAEPEFPGLTGRVVDGAAILSADQERDLTAKLADLEAKTTDQFVIVTLTSLQGYEIEDFGYQLGRHWAIGQEDKNNGVLLIVAPTERAVRIEVGYGLEGLLTDALSRIIIERAILPHFRAGNMAEGVLAGSADILETLTDGELTIEHASPAGADQRNVGFRGVDSSDTPLQTRRPSSLPPVWWFLWFGFVIIFAFISHRNGGSIGGGSWSHRSGGWSSSSGSRGGGFSGGGGSFGGGGASGRW